MHVTSMTINYIVPFLHSPRLEMASGSGTQAPITRPGRRMWPIIAAVVVIIIVVGGILAYVYLLRGPNNGSFVCDPTKAGSCTVTIQGAGATFPQFIWLNWTKGYNQLYPNVTISYNLIGSTAGK